MGVGTDQIDEYSFDILTRFISSLREGSSLSSLKLTNCGLTERVAGELCALADFSMVRP